MKVHCSFYPEKAENITDLKIDLKFEGLKDIVAMYYTILVN
jgi:hypothetical protein